MSRISPEPGGSQAAGRDLVTLLEEQRDLYRELRELGSRQRPLISADDAEPLLALLRGRQELITRLMRVQTELGPHRRVWRERLASLPPVQRDCVLRLVKESDALLESILQEDQEDSALLTSRKQMLAVGVRNVSGAQAVHAAYAGTAQPQSNGSHGVIHG